MSKKHKPRSGSKSYYPRVRAKRELPVFKYCPVKGEGARILNFVGYKAGMLHIIARDNYKLSRSYGHEVSVPATVIECPPLKVYGVRAYRDSPYGEQSIGEAWAEKIDRHLEERIGTHRGSVKDAKKVENEGAGGAKRGEKESARGAKKDEAKKGKENALDRIDALKGEATSIRLLAHTQPALTGIGKKKAEAVELKLSGNVEEQLKFAKERIGSEISVSEVIAEKQFIDIKAVTKGKGIQGVVKRFGVKIHRPKAKKRRIVGSIGPWTPATVMRTVARAGQMGYHTRTECNKCVLAVGENGMGISPASGFCHYGVVRNPYIVVAGSVPGNVNRAIALRYAARPAPQRRYDFGEFDFISTKAMHGTAVAEEAASMGGKAEGAKA